MPSRYPVFNIQKTQLSNNGPLPVWMQSDKQAVKVLKVLGSFEAADGAEDMAGEAAQCLIGQAAKGLYGPPPVSTIGAEEVAAVDDGCRRALVQGLFEQPCSAARSRLIQMLVEVRPLRVKAGGYRSLDRVPVCSAACLQGDDRSALARILRHGLSLHPDNRAQGNP